jgi:Prokaryotic homologs of the JAB domain
VRPIPNDRYRPAPAAIPPRPYRMCNRHLHLPAALPETLSAALASAIVPPREAGALLYGVRRPDEGDPHDMVDTARSADVVQALVIPDQIRHPTHYRMPYEAIAAASAATRAGGWVTLAQVHTHPSHDVEHSWYDDRHAISTRVLSIVLPHYGCNPSDWLDHLGVHDFQDDWWHHLSRDQVAARVSFVEAPLQILDLRTHTARTTA